ncbi:Uncharacterised protein [Serratia ficaria]|uniref:hypothetical protein n=1 Tax=Serratia ficaria TaxID=61651 RepID=UPI0021782137|nr:hypothetical protein [Serratia ficaria]CAI1023487.1 Uncharacterised protein [Serratia ficaria]CAI1860250.1 Uncharacterised protein [Serratia ficaria]CAI2471991.1 Uncharacterised protein [Serratia ficaria]
MKIITRVEAAKLGLNKFYTGKVCKHGHLSERWVNNGGCVQCTIERVYRQRRDLIETMKAAKEVAYG